MVDDPARQPPPTSRSARTGWKNTAPGLRHAGTGGLLAAAGVLAAAMPAMASTTATATGDTRAEVGDGLVQARGAALRIPVTFTCPQDWKAQLGLQVVQAVDDHLASAYNSEEGASLVCTGQAQTRTLYLQAGANEGGAGRPFRPGPASVIASVYAYDVPDPDGTCLGIGPCLGSVMSYGTTADRHTSAQDKETIQLRQD